MKILITGGNGYIARNLKRLLTNKGYEIHAPSHADLDLLNRPLLTTYFETNRFDAIIHCATKGGRRYEKDTFEEVYVPNITMFENLTIAATKEKPIILFGSGAEFDRRNDITKCREATVYSSWPIDPYGLSKNIITRRTRPNMWMLRLFGCFNYDEDNERFIKNCILNIKQNTPIKIHKNKIMDFFFLDDILPIIERILKGEYTAKNINLVYPLKMDLITIADEIAKYARISKYSFEICNPGMANEYTGNGEILDSLNLPLVGLQEGIRRTVKELI